MELLWYTQLAGSLVGTLVVGLVAHELAHLVTLRLWGIPCAVEILPTRGDDRTLPGLGSPLAQVRPTPTVGSISPRHLRVAALMPLWLAVPLVLIFAGVIADPFVSGSVSSRLVLIAWIGCSIPSPRDFALAWHPEQAIAADSTHTASPNTPPRPADTLDGGGRE